MNRSSLFLLALGLLLVLQACSLRSDDDDGSDDDDSAADDDDSAGDDDDSTVDDDDTVPPQPPQVEITSPDDGAGFGLGQVVPLRASVIDPDSAPQDIEALWTSDLDGELASQQPAFDGLLALDRDDLSTGLHQVTLRVTDEDAQVAEASVQFRLYPYSLEFDAECRVLSPGDSLSLSPSGNWAPPLTWSMVDAPSGGGVSADGTYSAGAIGGVRDVVRAQDSNGVASEVGIDVVAGWSGSQLGIAVDPYSNSRSYRVSSADYDHDGDVDLIVANIGSGFDRIFVNDGTGAMSVSEPFPLTASREIKFIDYDDDRYYDVAFGGSDSSGSHLYRNQDTAGFAEVFAWGSSTEDCLGMAVGDLDSDGFPEIVCAHNQDAHPTEMTVLLNVDDGSGGRDFSQIYFHGPHMSQALSLADVDADGDLDLAVGGSNLTASATPVDNLLCLNDGAAGLTCTPQFGTGRTHEVAFADLDDDGDPDLLLSNNQEPLAIWWNQGGSPPTWVEDHNALDPTITMGGVRQLGLDDVDGDGDRDILVVQGGATATGRLYLNQGDGSFCPLPVFDSSQSLSSRGVQASHFADLNGDAVLDFVVTRYRDYNEIWLSQ